MRLARAAIRLELPLPPSGRIEPKRRPPRPFPGGHRGPQGSRLWKPEELARLGTMPDKDLAASLGLAHETFYRELARLESGKLITRRRGSIRLQKTSAV